MVKRKSEEIELSQGTTTSKNAPEVKPPVVTRAELTKTNNPRVKRPSKLHTAHIINNQHDYSALYFSLQPMDIFCWGTGSMCELGLGPLAKNKEVKRPRINGFLPRETVKIVSFAVGGMHTLAVDTENNIWSWGCNDVGALGRDTSGAKEVLRDIGKEDNDNDEDEDGDLNELESTPMKIPRELFPPLVDPADGVRVVQVAATDNMSCVLLSNGDIYAWGTFRCNEGILGFYQDKIKIQRTPWRLPRFSKYEIVQLAAGKDHILFLDEEGMVFAWGNGQQYQLGRKVMERYRLRTLDPRPLGLKHIKYIASGENHCFAVRKDGKLFSWGLNQFGQCGTSDSIEDGSLVTSPTPVKFPNDEVKNAFDGSKIKAIAAGEHHSLILLENGDLYSFGRVDMFEIGIPRTKFPEGYTYRDEHERPRAVPLPTKLQDVPKFKQVAAGSHHSLAIAKNGIVYSWGFGETYAVGQGPSGDDIEVPTRIKNTATQDHNIIMVGCGGQFSVSGGVKLTEEEIEKRADEMDD